MIYILFYFVPLIVSYFSVREMIKSRTRTADLIDFMLVVLPIVNVVVAIVALMLCCLGIMQKIDAKIKFNNFFRL